AAASFQTPFAQPFPTPGSFPSFPAYSPSTSITISSVSPTLRSARLQQFGFSAQTELARNTLLEIGYTGSRGDHLMRTLSLNQARLASPSNPIRGQISNTLANVRDRVRVQGIASGAPLLVDTGGESWYNDLEANL